MFEIYVFIYYLFTFHGSFGINPLDIGIINHKQRYINKTEVCTVIIICCNTFFPPKIRLPEPGYIWYML
jgi:hypothetical protein